MRLRSGPHILEHPGTDLTGTSVPVIEHLEVFRAPPGNVSGDAVGDEVGLAISGVCGSQGALEMGLIVFVGGEVEGWSDVVEWCNGGRVHHWVQALVFGCCSRSRGRRVQCTTLVAVVSEERRRILLGRGVQRALHRREGFFHQSGGLSLEVSSPVQQKVLG